MNDIDIVIKSGIDLTAEEVKAINKAQDREWKVSALTDKHRSTHIFVLVKKNSEVLAQGQFNVLDKVTFAGEVFSLWEVGGIIANEKGKGYGRILLQAMIDYLQKNKKTGIGFASNRVRDFYEKCGFTINESSLTRFVNYQKLSGGDEDYVFYLDSEDGFMEKVLVNPQEKVYLV